MSIHPPLLLFLAGIALATAQPVEEPAAVPTNAPTPAAAVGAVDAAAPVVSAGPETHIYSDTVELGIKTRSAIYRGNVRLEDPRIHLTCEELSADVPEEGKRVERVVARTNVVVLLIDEQGRTNRAYADQAVYTFQAGATGTNELVELTGAENPRIERQEGTLYGDVIIWDRVRNQIRATNQRMIYRAELVSGTNRPASNPPESPAGQPPAAHE
jgi:lipopolysaccharide export system protein LptA